MRVKASELLSSPTSGEAIIRLEIEPAKGKRIEPFIPGQIVRLGLPGVHDPKPGYFAIASEPARSDAFEFVIKNRPGIAALLASLEPGSTVEVEGPMGHGFDLAPFVGCDVYLIGVGTGVAPLRSVWRHLISHREQYGAVHIYCGFLTPCHRLLTDELEALSEHDIEVSVSVTSGSESWDGPIGYVQDTLRLDAPDGKNSVACLAGMNAMVDACRETLQNLDFDDSHILLNY
ncbi:MAG: hydrogenase [Zetaproteobacteria bacterium CG12_big_fil_rev_8_21_14_0_65_55_1124]|nr:MAG: hydrogenase [Zetaproteobacteria bacterium CG1_02_55_237]PIS18521.1 MAG: hydrogenase [Zetaproteobacteria bacterium CG08_land_8_20_14_0_20_55_17]PIW41999.1 MAG: hydrogenase [Zetaproteobacteria bacterium CG12_big_fil_rev_8_21_14_0_65_55_1124]PIY53903.1 MAG: hydrogenase [Zetaproteobacteria bacterium CG_4_10_14_0_8_um_filter_55_43]PIZ39348.1 MAG: hydrogenase [Zetaproteobacteria bacterium CG_4_10_14_0_2_um_filter_55_20]PJB80703.1 MAG: hydrogenase [Zetaproteobacteria bacterium CG_4_9_14_0_8_u